jgi:drug/metabolite transporter (DMT)-like permease
VRAGYVLTLIEPFVAVISAALFLGPSIGGLTILGGALIVGGALLVITARPTME